MTVTSKIRIGNWIQGGILFFVSLFIIFFLICYPFDNIVIDVEDFTFWIGFFTAIALFYGTRKFLLQNLRRITVNEQGVVVKHLLSSKIEEFSYDEIVSINAKRSKFYDEGTVVYGVYTMEIHLENNTIITLGEDQFKNYTELKGQIFAHYKTAQE